MAISDYQKWPAMVVSDDWQWILCLVENRFLDLGQSNCPILAILAYVGCLGVVHLVVRSDLRKNGQQSAGGDGQKMLSCLAEN